MDDKLFWYVEQLQDKYKRGHIECQNFFFVKITDYKQIYIVTDNEYYDGKYHKIEEYDIFCFCNGYYLKNDFLNEFKFVKTVIIISSILGIYLSYENGIFENKVVKINIPNNIENIYLHDDHSLKNIILPNNLKKLHIESVISKITNLPEGLKHLYLKTFQEVYLIGKYVNVEYIEIPKMKNLKVLYLENYNGCLNNFSNSIESLCLINCKKQRYDCLPSNLKKLTIKSCFQDKINLDFLPETLETLEIHAGIYGKLENLPRSLLKVIINDRSVEKKIDIDIITLLKSQYLKELVVKQYNIYKIIDPHVVYKYGIKKSVYNKNLKVIYSN